MGKVLTFDLGTTYFKVCLFDEATRLVAQHRIAVPVERPTPGRCELPVDIFCRCLVNAVHEVGRRACGLSDVTRVSFASQANSFTLLDEDSQPLLPVLLWTDERAHEALAPLHSLTTRPDFYGTTGVAELNHLFMPAKLLWLHQHKPDIVSRTRRLCSMADYLVWWLTGNHLTEASLAGLTGMVDIHRLEWWPEATQLVNVPSEWLPPITRAGSDSGRLRAKVAKELGLPRECRCIIGCLDQYAGAIGAGNVKTGRVSETTGTVLATICYSNKFRTDVSPGVFQGPACAPGGYYRMMFSSVSAGLLERYRNGLPDRPTFSELDMLAAQVPAGAEGLRLDQVAALRFAPDIFIGRSSIHQRGHEVRAIMEGVALELRRQVTTLSADNWPAAVQAAGGAARSATWLKIKSEVLGCPVEAVACPEPTSMGAARLVQASGF